MLNLMGQGLWVFLPYTNKNNTVAMISVANGSKGQSKLCEDEAQRGGMICLMSCSSLALELGIIP